MSTCISLISFFFGFTSQIQVFLPPFLVFQEYPLNSFLCSIANYKNAHFLRTSSCFFPSTKSELQEYFHCDKIHPCPICYRRQATGLCLVAQQCPTLCYPMDSVAFQAPLCMGILQAGILERVAMPFSRGSSQPRDGIQVSCIAVRFFTV